jgi:hypothetical protein
MHIVVFWVGRGLCYNLTDGVPTIRVQHSVRQSKYQYSIIYSVNFVTSTSHKRGLNGLMWPNIVREWSPVKDSVEYINTAT